jgi:ureidoglycolate lyase
MKQLKIELLSKEAFADFGDVIEAADWATHYTINGGNTERYHDLMRIEVDEQGRPIVSIFRGQAREFPFEICMMERHPLGSQCFVPMSGRPYLVAVARKGDDPGVDDLRVFLASAAQGVNYARGVWHHPLLAIDEVSDFLVLDRSGPGNNCEEHFFEHGAVIPAPTPR